MQQETPDERGQDALIEELARPALSPGHTARVLARSGPIAGACVPSRHRRWAPRLMQPGWMLPCAATLLAMFAAGWQSERAMRTALERVMDGSADVTRSATLPVQGHTAGEQMAGSSVATALPDTSETRPSRARPWGPLRDIARPVLPPEAYWAMSPFEEFKALRASTRAHALQRAREPRAERRLDWVPQSSRLPPIELTPIATARLDIAPITPVEAVSLSEIAIEQIRVTPLSYENEEKP